MNLPDSLDPYTDVYFLRSKYILEQEGLNPFVRAQIFIRNGPGKIFGIEEALALVQKYSALSKNGGHVFSLSDGDQYYPTDTVMLLEGCVLDIITLETILLGVISAATTRANDHKDVDLDTITQRTRDIVQILSGRPLYYFGARHWHYRLDADISKAAFDGGASGASTEIGARTANKKPVGTIPHSLECIFAWKYGINRAVTETIQAFDRWIEKAVPRIPLVDFANKEIDDSLASAKVVANLSSVRVDTAEENSMQGAKKDKRDEAYWYGTGVCISGIYALREAFNAHGFSNVSIILSGGFGNKGKLQAFVDAERRLHIKLFDAVGVGELFPVRSATMDIVGVSDNPNVFQPIAKIGRLYKPNSKLKQIV
ncbi:nicotinate phosphoribosyltransferase [Candidatus Gottesmanbacteria bacterium]|nr:nicotinate phosphoribosyltransferase [Candidatus Gottesmanbacteria bacterium]